MLLDKIKNLKFPEPLLLLLGCIVLATVATYVVPAGMFDRVVDSVTGKEVAIAGSYHRIPSGSVGFFEMFVAIPKGMQQAGSVIFFVFLVGGAFVVISKTGALNSLVSIIVSRFSGKEMLIVPICILLFAGLGAIQNFQEEIIALVPVLLLLCKRLGFNRLTAVILSIGAAIVGAAFSPINPFQVGIAQKVAGVDLLSASVYRGVFLFLAVVVYTILVYLYVKNTKSAPEAVDGETQLGFPTRHKVIIGLLIAMFTLLVIGVSRWDWDFEQMAALFFVGGIISGLVGGLGTGGTVDSFVEGLKDMAYAGLLIGFARAIFVVLEDGQIVDSLVNGMFTPMSQLPTYLSLSAITVMQSLIHFPVPSVSGQAVLTMPLLAPLADIMGVSRQMMVLSYQYGAGLAELIVPTNGAVIAILTACKVPFGQWLKFSIKAYFILLVLGIIAIYIAEIINI